MPRRIMTTPLIIALPKGRILKEALPLLARIGIVPEADFTDENSRKLTFATSRDDVRVIRVRSFDVATFVAFFRNLRAGRSRDRSLPAQRGAAGGA
jgi:ATP phosphoribosyltransferase